LGGLGTELAISSARAVAAPARGPFISLQSPSLRILLIDEIKDRAAAVEEALRRAGHRIVALLDDPADLVAAIEAAKPDVIILDLNTPDRDTIESLRHATQEHARPIVMFVDRSDETMIAEAIRAGVTAYVVDGLNPQRVKPVLDVAVARFQQFQALTGELSRAKASLAERKVVDRAKGILMQQKGMSEDEAYNSLRRLAMDQGKRIGEVAENLITAAKLLR
jgi:response regulator NasT